jgi:mono/diheme cytochrome c family protein
MIENRPAKVLIVLLLCALAVASFAKSPSSAKEAGAAMPVVQITDADGMRVAGEQRYHANCGRCHAAPQKFSPRMMNTVLRHMRVRATITDEDRRLILFYMTQ